MKKQSSFSNSLKSSRRETKPMRRSSDPNTPNSRVMTSQRHPLERSNGNRDCRACRG